MLLFSWFYTAIAYILILKFKRIYGIGQTYMSSTGNTYYVDLDLKYTWFDSQDACSKMNMTLLNMNRIEKTPDVGQILKKAQIQHNVEFEKMFLWIGSITKPIPKTHFVSTPSGEKYVFNAKSGYKPDFHDSNEYCVEMRLEIKPDWYQDSCEKKNGFICEFNGDENIPLKESKLKNNRDLGNLIKAEIEKNNILQKELQNEQAKQMEYKDQMLKVKDQYLQIQEKLIKHLQDKLDLKDELKVQQNLQHQLQLQVQNLMEQNSKLKKDLEDEILKHKN